MRKNLFLIAMLTLFCVSAVSAQDMLSLVKSKYFRFTAFSMNSSLTREDPRFASFDQGLYRLDVEKDLLDCKLPFVGRVYRHAMNDQHIEVYAEKYKMEYKEVKRRKTKEIVVKITAPSKEGHERFTFTLTIGEKGNANLTIISSNRETITYVGKVEPLSIYR